MCEVPHACRVTAVRAVHRWAFVVRASRLVVMLGDLDLEAVIVWVDGTAHRPQAVVPDRERDPETESLGVFALQMDAVWEALRPRAVAHA